VNLPAKARIYIYIVGLLAVVAIAYYAPEFSFTSFKQVVAFVLFIFLGFLSEVYATWIPVYGGEISSSLTIYLAALFILGPSLTVFAVLITILGSEILLRWNYIKDAPMRFVHTVTFNVAQWVVTVAVTGIILIVWRHAPFSLRFFNDYIWALGAFLCYSGINLSLVTGIVSLTENKRFFYAFKTCMRDFGLQYLVFCVLALLLVVLYSLSIWHMVLAILPLVLVHVSFRSYLRLQTETRKTFEKISRILDERDHYTAVHSSEVAELAVKIGQEMGLPQGEIEKIDIAARVHDIGKIAVPDAILLKPAPLTEEEWEVMKHHPLISAELIEGLEIYTPVADAVRHEHERWDGSGYPDGLKGEEIPLLARIIAAADIYNALVTRRPYRKALTNEQAVETIRNMRGKDLDPIVTDALLRVIASQRT